MTKISEKGIEKAARAMCAAEGHKYPDVLICPAFDHHNPRPRWTFYADNARAAITAYLDVVETEDSNLVFSEWKDGVPVFVQANPPSDSAPAGWRDGNKPLPFDHETLGRMVREAWLRWAQTQPAPKPSWLAPYDELTEADKEADRQIGESIARWTLIGDASRNCLASVPEPPVSDGWQGKLATLRAMGWAVAVHNDYRLNGVPHTFWLFTRDGIAIKGEGISDDDALACVLAATPKRRDTE